MGECHFKNGDVILLTDESVNKLLTEDCIIEEGVIFRFHYNESTEENQSYEVEEATTSKESIEMPEVKSDVSEQQSLPEEEVSQVQESEQEVVATTTQADVPFDVNQILTTTGGGGGVAIILAIVAILGGGAAWKFYQKFSEQKHEQKMKELEIQAQSQGLNGAQPPPCQAANAALEAKLVGLETKLASIEKKTSSFSAGFDSEDIEDRLIKLEKKVKSLSART